MYILETSLPGKDILSVQAYTGFKFQAFPSVSRVYPTRLPRVARGRVYAY